MCEQYKYPCTVLISEYEEIEPYEDMVSNYVRVIKLDDLINELQNERGELERRFETRGYSKKEASEIIDKILNDDLEFLTKD